MPLSQTEKQQLQGALNAAQEEEGSLAAAKRALEARLEEAQRGLAHLGQEQQALSRALEEEGKQQEALRRGKAELEEQKRLLNGTVDRLNKEVGTGWPGLFGRGPTLTEACLGGEGGTGGQDVWYLLSSSPLLGRPRPNPQRVAPFLSPLCFCPFPHMPFLYDLEPW